MSYYTKNNKTDRTYTLKNIPPGLEELFQSGANVREIFIATGSGRGAGLDLGSQRPPGDSWQRFPDRRCPKFRRYDDMNTAYQDSKPVALAEESS